MIIRPHIDLPTARFSGRFLKFEAFRGIADKNGQCLHEFAGTRRNLAGESTNLITNQGMDYIGNFSDYLNHCHVGSSSTTPNQTNTSLVTYVAGTSTITSSVYSAAASSPYYGAKTITFRFGIGAAAGNLSEVGVGRTLADGSLFSRALIVDGGGSPTTITVLGDEFLDVTYELRQYAPLSDVTGSATLDGISRNYTIRAIAATSSNVWAKGIGSQASGTWSASGSGSPYCYTGALVAITDTALSGQLDLPTTKTNSSYSNGTFYVQTAYYWEPGTATNSAIQSQRFTSSVGSYQMDFDPVLNKGSEKALTHNFRYHWARR